MIEKFNEKLQKKKKSSDVKLFTASYQWVKEDKSPFSSLWLVPILKNQVTEFK